MVYGASCIADTSWKCPPRILLWSFATLYQSFPLVVKRSNSPKMALTKTAAYLVVKFNCLQAKFNDILHLFVLFSAIQCSSIVVLHKCSISFTFVLYVSPWRTGLHPLSVSCPSWYLESGYSFCTWLYDCS